MHAWLESVTYQWIAMGHTEAMQTLGETVCLLKVQSTKVLELCAKEALHTFGGYVVHLRTAGNFHDRCCVCDTTHKHVHTEYELVAGCI